MAVCVTISAVSIGGRVPIELHGLWCRTLLGNAKLVITKLKILNVVCREKILILLGNLIKGSSLFNELQVEYLLEAVLSEF